MGFRTLVGAALGLVLSFSAASMAQRNRLTPGTEVTLTLRAEGIHLLKGE